MPRRRLTLRRLPEHWILALTLVTVLGLLHLTGAMTRPNLLIYDAMLRLAPSSPAADVAVVAIDENSLEHYGRWPWPRYRHAELIDRLRDAGARVIVFDLLFTEPSADTSDDLRLATAMKLHGKVILPVHLAPLEHEGSLTEFLPTAGLTRAAVTLGHPHVELDDDGLARGLYLRAGIGSAYWPSLALAAYDQSHDQPWPMHAEPVSSAPFVNVRSAFIRIPFAGKPGSQPTWSYYDVMTQPEIAAALRDKVVFVGATAPGFGDSLPTPVSRLAAPLSGVEFHASAYSALAQNAAIQPISRGLTLSLECLLALVIALMLQRLAPGRALIGIGALALGVLLVPFWLLWATHQWIAPAAALFIVLMAYPLWSWRRIAQLNRFLADELERLEQAPARFLRRFRELPPERMLQALRDMLHPSGWILIEDGIAVSHHGLVLADQPEKLKADVWKHNKRDSWILFERVGRQVILGLRWSPAQDLNDQRAFVDSLPFHISPKMDAGARRTSAVTERITRRIDQVRRAIDAVDEMRRTMARGFELMPDGILLTDALGIIQFSSKRISDWTNEPASSLQGQSLPLFLSARAQFRQENWRELLVETLVKGQSRSVEARIGKREFMVRFAPFDGVLPGDHGLLVNLSDITDIREEQRRRSEAIDFISHDVRSPLVSQLALLADLREGAVAVTPQALDRLRNLAKRSHRLAESFVQLARAEETESVTFYPVELLSVLENAVDSVSDLARTKHISLTLFGDDEATVHGNAELLERALTNLLANAIKYSAAETEVTAQLTVTDELAIIEIRDQGRGIDAHELPFIFDRYRRQQKSENSTEKGAGLGLAFVKVVVDKHRGRIAIQSEPDCGTTFSLLLPVDDRKRLSDHE